MGRQTVTGSTRFEPLARQSSSARELRRQDLADFLRFKRANRSLDEVVPAKERRRVEGLRREEVAQRAGISSTWYTWLEQGREINASDDSILRICKALELTPAQSEYALSLLHLGEAPEFRLHPELPGSLKTLVDSYGSCAAYVATARYDLVISNDWTQRLFDLRAANGLESNVLWRFFTDPYRRSLYNHWDATARTFADEFRRAYTLYRGNEHFESLLIGLLETPDFARIWRERQVAPRPPVIPVSITHPSYGHLQFTMTTATLHASPDCFLAVFAAG